MYTNTNACVFYQFPPRFYWLNSENQDGIYDPTKSLPVLTGKESVKTFYDSIIKVRDL